MKIEYNDSKALKHSNSYKLEYLGKCLLIEEKEKKILVIGDLHLGYEEILNRAGVFVTRKMFEEMIAYFDLVFSRTRGVDKIVLLGDVKHSFGGIVGQEWSDALALFDYLKGKLKKNGEIIIVKGNHDNIIGPIARKGGIGVKDYFIFGEIAFLHGDKDFEEIWERRVTNWIVGHGHPAVKLGDGVKVESYKCFLTGKFKGKEIIVMPSFFDYSVGSDPRENELGLAWNFNLDKFRVRVVGEDLEVLDFGILKDL